MGSLIVPLILGGIFLASVVFGLALSLGLMILTNGQMPPTDEGLWI